MYYGVMIEISGLTRTFGNFVAVSDLKLHVPQGVIFGFLGPIDRRVAGLEGLAKPPFRTWRDLELFEDPFGHRLRRTLV